LRGTKTRVQKRGDVERGDEGSRDEGRGSKNEGSMDEGSRDEGKQSPAMATLSLVSSVFNFLKFLLHIL
jgi:hypothetical protein